MFLGVGCPGDGVANQVENSNEGEVVPFQLSPIGKNESFLYASEQFVSKIKLSLSICPG